MSCANCDYDPCMCGRYDYSEEPTSVCRMCDCYPCMCGRNDFRSEAEVRIHKKFEEKGYCDPDEDYS